MISKPIEIGNEYRNKKKGTIYTIVLLSKHTETGETMVSYTETIPEDCKTIPVNAEYHSRPMGIFLEKFEDP